MDTTFKQWQEALDKFEGCVKKDLAEVIRQKAEVQAIRDELMDKSGDLHYIRDNKRIIISAPEIIIGNVDRAGQLWNGGSAVVLRGNNIAVDGAGNTGSVQVRAPRIKAVAVDPGSDGCQSVVCDTSEITAQAKSLALSSEKASSGAFVYSAGGSAVGINIHSDTVVNVSARKGNSTLVKGIESRTKSLKSLKGKLESGVSESKKEMDRLFKEMTDAIGKADGLNDANDAARSNVSEIEEIRDSIKDLTPQLWDAVNTYIGAVSQLAETERAIKCMDKAKNAANSIKGDFKKKSSGTAVNIGAENVRVNISDGDGNIRENSSAGVSVNSVNVNVFASKADGSLIPSGKVNVLAETVSLSSANPKIKDAKNAEYTAGGAVKVLTGNFAVEAVDYEVKDGKVKEKALTKNGAISLRAQNFDLSATDTEGKAAGHANINAKSLSIKSMDVDKDKRTDKSPAKDGSMLLLAEKMFAGASDDANRSKQFQLSSEKLGVFAKTTAEIQQDKAVVQLDGGKLSLAGNETALMTKKTTVGGALDVKGDVTAPKASVKNLEASTSFKSANISDGIAVNVPASPANLSPKLKEEKAPKEEQK